MKLTTFQKEIIDKIISKDVYDVYSFIEVLFGVKKTNYNWRNGPQGFINFHSQDQIKQIDHNYLFLFEEERFQDYSNKIISYIILFDYLKRERLIMSVEILTRKFIPIFKGKDNQSPNIDFTPPVDKINKLLLDCFHLEFLNSPELEEFKRRGYLTLSEFDIVEQNKDRKRSLRWTIVTAFTAIILSLASIVLQIIFSGKERDVKIVNDNAFPESSKIILLNKIEKQDSLGSNNSTKRDTTSLK